MSELPHLFLEFHGSETSVREQSEIVAEIAAPDIIRMQLQSLILNNLLEL